MLTSCGTTENFLKSARIYRKNELRTLLSQSEDRISKSHQNELRNQEINIQRYEDLSQKFKNLQLVKEQLEVDFANLRKEKNDLVEKNAQWTSVLKDKTREL